MAQNLNEELYGSQVLMLTDPQLIKKSVLVKVDGVELAPDQFTIEAASPGSAEWMVKIPATSIKENRTGEITVHYDLEKN